MWLAGYRAARTRFPPRMPAADWPASMQAREQVHEQLAGLRPGQAGALGALLDWLGGQDGGSWQQRWLASGADAAGTAWRQQRRLLAEPVVRLAVPVTSALVSALITAVCAGLVRPSLAWLAAGGCEHAELARAMSALRDPGGFTQLQALCDGGSAAAVSKTARTRTLRPGCGHAGR